MASVNEFLSQKFFLFLRIILFSVSTYVFPLFFRLKRNDSNSNENSDHPRVIFGPDNEEKLELIEYKAEDDEENEVVLISEDLKNDETGENEPEICFNFKFPTYEELSERRTERWDLVKIEGIEAFAPSTNRYELNSVKSLSCIINEPEVLKCEVKEGDIVSSGGYFGDSKIDLDHDDGFSLNNEFFKLITEDFQEEIENSISGLLEEEEHNSQKDDFLSKEPIMLEEILDSDSDSDSNSSSSNHLHSVMSSFLDSYGDEFLSDGGGFLSEGDFEQENSIIDGEKIQSNEENLNSDHNNEEEFEKEDVIEENKVLEEANSFLWSEKTRDFSGKHNPDKSEKEKFPAQDSEETNKLESLWEHQELIEQLKLELKKVRATGLPTILEESESPKIMEDLKPWKIDEKFQHENSMDELQISYKSYRERMRKLDILNYQKMYAIGFLQLKDPLQPVPTNKSSITEIATFLSQNLDLCKHKKKQSEPTMKFMEELRSDLEVVYVGQMCLSWEILHWQYGKAVQLWESDPRGIRLFNEVAGEFQQFNIFMQRFIEDECFQGPRVQNYIKNRCVLRNLLQVPLIREDNSKDKRKAKFREKSEYAITSAVLVEIIEESIRTFWRFVRADKVCNISSVKGKDGKSDPTDLALFMEVQKNLLKKDRKLKDILRSGNCILRKIKKCREDGSNSDNQVLYFFSQVDMKLVSRVLNMSRLTTDQLIWCREKLSKISLVGRKINVEPAFLLFPC